MSLGRRLRQAGLFAALAALTALACGSDTISLLPVTSSGSAGQAGSAGTSGLSGSGAASGDAGAHDGGSHNGGEAGRGGAAGGGMGGNVPLGGALCSGPSCAGAFNLGGNPIDFGGGTCVTGIDNCISCGPNGQCPQGLKCSRDGRTKNKCVSCLNDGDCPSRDLNCDFYVGRCAPQCQSTDDCGPGHLCDPTPDVCVECFFSEDCERMHPQKPVCHERRCVECEFADDCPGGRGKRYCIAYGCYECMNKNECPDGLACQDGHCR